MTKTTEAALDTAIAELRAMTSSKRAHALAHVFCMVAMEIAAMVMENVQRPKPKRRPASRRRAIKRRQ